MQAGAPAGPGAGGQKEEEKKGRFDDIKDLAAMLQVIGNKAEGRGVTKNDQTPAQRDGLYPQNPKLFGAQQKQPIPYQKILANGKNLKSFLSGFQEASAYGGLPQEDVAQVTANANRTASLISSAFDNRTTTSLYAGVPKSAAQNLYEINKRNARENSLYAFN